MRKCILLVFVVLLSSAWMMAQYSGSQSSQQQGTTGSDVGSAATQNSTSSSTESSAGQSSSGTMSSQSSASSNMGKNLEGCLSGSNGNYTLTDNAGNTYQLMGDTAQLSKHVGQEIRVSGSRVAANGENGMGTAGTNGAAESATSGENTSSGTPPSVGGTAMSANSFNVTGVKKISGTCSNAGNMSK
jgi:cytoskeletal protein RodZ